MDIYGASEIIELDAGYYIIMRLPLDKEDVQKRVDDLLGQYQYASLKRQLDAQDGKIAFEGMSIILRYLWLI